jgi:GNAT superfamily N-acetyltransferase
MDAVARQRAATVAVWRADVQTRAYGGWAQLGDLALHATGIPVGHWNGCHVTGTDTPWADAAAWFAEREVPWGVLIPEESDVEPPGPPITTQRVMLRDLENLPDLPVLDLRWDAGDDATAVQSDAFGDPLADATAFVLPKLLNPACAVVTAYLDDLAAATATLVVVDGVGAVFGVGTLPGVRGQGLGRAVTLAVLHEARRRGCDLAYLNPSDLGYGVYARLGFTDAPGWGVFQATL